MKDVTAVLIGFLRPDYTKNCICSLREEFPRIPIRVAENGDYTEDMVSFMNKYNAYYYKMPWDSGVCTARNYLISKTKTKYVLVGDDDFQYDKEARVPQMVKFLDNNKEYSLIGGRVREDGRVRDYQGFTEYGTDRQGLNYFKSTEVNLNKDFKIDKHSGLRYEPCDLTFNFFVARTKDIKKVPWDENIKVAYEHFDWFWQFKLANKKVAFSPDPIVIHRPDIGYTVPKIYSKYRLRSSDKEWFQEKYNLDYTLTMNGLKIKCK